MSWIRQLGPSLLDTANSYPVEWWLAFTDTAHDYWWNRFLEPGFRHVIALKREGGGWIAFHSRAEFVDIEIIYQPVTAWDIVPGATIQRVVAFRKAGIVRSAWHTGPITCVENVKALLGIRNWRVRTPYQLHRYCGRAYGRDQGFVEQRNAGRWRSSRTPRTEGQDHRGTHLG